MPKMDKFRRNFRKLKFTYVATLGIGNINVSYLFGPVSIKSIKIRSFGEATSARPHSHTSRAVTTENASRKKSRRLF